MSKCNGVVVDAIGVCSPSSHVSNHSSSSADMLTPVPVVTCCHGPMSNW